MLMKQESIYQRLNSLPKKRENSVAQGLKPDTHSIEFAAWLTQRVPACPCYKTAGSLSFSPSCKAVSCCWTCGMRGIGYLEPRPF